MLQKIEIRVRRVGDVGFYSKCRRNILILHKIMLLPTNLRHRINNKNSMCDIVFVLRCLTAGLPEVDTGM